MNAGRAMPPELQGFEHVRWLGGGGFADVYLFRQRRPNRDVAVKVLRQSIFDAAVQQQFEAEADLMGAVSEHPFIVSIHAADIAPDGRPYLVMEFYPNGTYLDRARRGEVTVAESLRVGIQIASAVETAHEAGIFHNDIKPANILLSALGRPGLTDFGISVVDVGGDQQGARGASLPYTAPEILDQDIAGSRTSDVFSLGASLYAMLAGHSPFERPNASNSPADIIDRVLRADPPPLQKPDVPPALENLIRQTLQRRPEFRPGTARTLATSLQGIEQQLGLQVTLLELRTEQKWSGEASSSESDDGTRLRAPVVVRPHQPSASAPPVAPPPPVSAPTGVPSVDLTVRPAPPTDATRSRQGWAADLHGTTDHTAARAPRPTNEAPGEAPAPPPVDGPPRRWKIAAGAVVAAIVAAGAVVTVLRDPAPEDGTSSAPVETIRIALPLLPPTDLTVRFTGERTVEATWTAPSGGQKPTDYLVTRSDQGAGGGPLFVADTRLVIEVTDGTVPCLSVRSRGGGALSQNATPTVCAKR